MAPAFRKILHIEDSETDAYVVKRAFRKLPEVEITWTPTGAEGLSQVLADPFDLVLLDYALPDMTGLEVLLRIMEKRPQTPVVIVSGFGSEYVAARGLHLGAIGYVNKDEPHFREELPQTLQRLYDQAEARRRAKAVEDLIRQRPSLRHHIEDVLATLKRALPETRGSFITSTDGLPLAVSRSEGRGKDVDALSAMVCGTVLRNLDMIGGNLALEQQESGLIRYKGGALVYRKLPELGSIVVIFDSTGDWSQDLREVEVAARDIEALVRQA